MKMERFRNVFKGNVEFGKDVIGIEILEPVNEDGEKDYTRHGIANIFINSKKILSLYDWKDDMLYDNDIRDFKIFNQLNIVYPVNSLLEKYCSEYSSENLSGEILEIDTDILNSPIYLKNALEGNIEDENLKNDIIKYTNIIKITEISGLENTKYYARGIKTKDSVWHDIDKIEIIYVISTSSDKALFILYDKDGNIIENNELTCYTVEYSVFKTLLDGGIDKSRFKLIKTSITDLLCLKRWYNSETKVFLDSHINTVISYKVNNILTECSNNRNDYEKYKVEWVNKDNIEIDDDFVFMTAHDNFTNRFPDYRHLMIGDSSNYMHSIETEDGKHIYAICVDTVDNFSLSKELLYTADGRRLLKCNNEVSEMLDLTESHSDKFIKARTSAFTDRYDYYIDIDDTMLNPYALEKIMKDNTLSDHDIIEMKYIIESYEKILKDTIKRYNEVLSEEN